jgi:anti-sigma-K factor RskA
MSDTGAKNEDERGPPIAAEYALGVLGAHERRAVEQRIAREPAFAREVAFWEERLGGLAQGIGPVTPPADAWARIEAGLDRASNANSASGLWQSLAFWRGLALGTSALAAACLAALIYVGSLAPPSGPLLARLDSEGGEVGFVAAANPADRSLAIVPAALLDGGPAPTSFELWVIPPGGTPHSLGLVDPSKAVRVVVPPELWPHVSADSVLAITVEPPGGSPTGKPTGPVIANGPLATL